jgi:uncharacterized protein (DUF1330 family)
MVAYLIFDIDLADRSKFKEYAKAVQITLVVFDGHYLSKWWMPETLDGYWGARRIVVIEFASEKQAKLW